MSIERRTRSDGRIAYVVRWYESGRGSARRKRTFDRRRDAELFDASLRRARQLGQLASEVIGSNATLEEFLVEWWDTYAVTHLRPSTLATYTYAPRQVDRSLPRAQAAPRRHAPDDRRLLRPDPADGAGAPTSTARSDSFKASSIAPSSGGDSPGTRSSACAGSRTAASETIDARTPETVEAIRPSSTRRTLRSSASRLRRPPSCRGIRARWSDVLDDQQAAQAPARRRALSGEEVSTPKSQRAREPELFEPSPASSSSSTSLAADPTRTRSSSRTPQAATFAAELAPAHLDPGARERRRRLLPQLRPPPHLRHAAPLRGSHAERGRRAPRPRRPGFTARTYAHVMRDAARRRRVPITEAIRTARAAAPRRPLVDPSAPSRRIALPLGREIPANRESRRADSNRGPLHYE